MRPRSGRSQGQLSPALPVPPGLCALAVRVGNEQPLVPEAAALPVLREVGLYMQGQYLKRPSMTDLPHKLLWGPCGSRYYPHPASWAWDAVAALAEKGETRHPHDDLCLGNQTPGLMELACSGRRAGSGVSRAQYESRLLGRPLPSTLPLASVSSSAR